MVIWDGYQRNDHCLLKVLFHHLPGGPKENHKNPQSGKLIPDQHWN